jgi:hypothetical protein
MVERGLPKPEARVRFPSPAPLSIWSNGINVFSDFGILQKAKVRKKVRIAALSYRMILENQRKHVYYDGNRRVD